MKKIIPLAIFTCLFSSTIKAQLNVSQSGAVSAGTIINPPTPCTFLSFGDAIFSNYPQSNYSAAYIRAGQINYTAPANPDYTWWNDNNTGIYHPNNNIIGISTGGYNATLIQYNSATGPYNSPIGPQVEFPAGYGFYTDGAHGAWNGEPGLYPNKNPPSEKVVFNTAPKGC